MKKLFLARLFAFAAALFLSSQVLFPVSLRAAETNGAAEEEQTEFDKTYLAAQYINEFMNLILEKYAGSPVTAEEMYVAAFRGITEILDDYSRFLTKEELDEFNRSMSGRLTGIGVYISQNEEGQPEILRVLPDTPAKEAGLIRGDVILSVNGKSTDKLPTDEVTALVLDAKNEKVKMQVRRGEETVTFEMTKREIPSVTVFTERFEDMLGDEYVEYSNNYRYVNISRVSETTAADFRTAVTAMKKEDVKGIVLDLRGNSGGYLHVIIEICQMIVPAGPILHTIDNKGNKETVNSRLSQKVFETIIVLTDKHTASAAELLAAALQDSKAAVLIGEKTYGKGVIQNMYGMSTGGALILTTEEYLRRGGGKVNGIGVRPDVAISGMNPRLYETEKDEALLKALEMMGK